MEEHSGLQNTLSIALLNSLQRKWTQDFVSSYACPAVLDCAFWSAGTSQESHPSKILTLALVPQKLHETWVYNTCIQISNIDKTFVETHYIQILCICSCSRRRPTCTFKPNDHKIERQSTDENHHSTFGRVIYIYIWIMCLSNSPVWKKVPRLCWDVVLAICNLLH